MDTTPRKNNFFAHDMGIIALSVLIAVILVKTNALSGILSSTKEVKLLGSFIAGLFFTSIFTTAPAMVALGEIAQTNPLMLTAFFGALGAVIGDLVIFRFVRDRFSGHLMELIGSRRAGKRLKAFSHLKFFRWLTFLVGGLIIASPLPDELGIGMMGFSKMSLAWFVPLSFTFNFIGVMIIGIVARSL